MTIFRRAALLLSLSALPLAALAQGLSGPSTSSTGAMPGAAMPGLSGGAAASPPGLVGMAAPGASAAPGGAAAPVVGTIGTIGDSGAIITHQGKIYETAQVGDATQGFLVIDNQGSAADTLTGLSCPIADTTSLVGSDGKPIKTVEVAPGKPAALAANGPHLALQSTHFQIFRGSVIPCTLTFQKAGQIQVLLKATKPPGG